MSEMYIDEEIINFLFEQLKISLKEKIKEESFNYKYIIGYSEIKKILKDKYDIDLDLNRVYEYEVDKMIKEIEKKYRRIVMYIESSDKVKELFC